MAIIKARYDIVIASFKGCLNIAIRAGLMMYRAILFWLDATVGRVC